MLKARNIGLSSTLLMCMASADTHASLWSPPGGASQNSPSQQGQDKRRELAHNYYYDVYTNDYYGGTYSYTYGAYYNPTTGYYSGGYYSHYDYDSYYGYGYGDYEEGNGNHDVDDDFIGSQDWDTWHEAEGQHEDDDVWTGDINDFLSGEGDRDHEQAMWSYDTDSSFKDRIIDIFTRENVQHDIAQDLSWITWAEEDVDFWEWFWLWYAQLDETWSFDHEPGFVVTDPTFEWEWFQNHTAGFNTTLDDIWIDRDDSEQWNWDGWDAYWRTYDAAVYAPDGFMYHSENVTEALAHDEDSICAKGSYLNAGNTCQPCPPGCTTCTSLGHCLSCESNFEAVTGPDFGFCFPRCFHGLYRQTVYADSTEFLNAIGVIDKEEQEQDADMKLVVPPHLMMQTCQRCAEGCRGCFAGLDGNEFCYECMHGFVYNETAVGCEVDPSWNKTDSTVLVHASKQTISQCDHVEVRMEPETGYNVTEALEDIVWNIHINGMELSEELNFMLQRLIRDTAGQQSFILDHKITSALEIGTEIKIVGFATGHQGATVHDTQVITVNDTPVPSLQYEHQYYVLAREGLQMELTKTHSKCPSEQQRPLQLDEGDWSRLSCKLQTIQRQFVRDLPNCAIPDNVLDEGNSYLIELEWVPRETKKSTSTNVAAQPEKHHIIVHTQTTKTICHFEEGNSMVVDTQLPHTLRPVLRGQDNLISRTTWSCEYLDSVLDCPYLEKRPTTEIQTTNFVPADYLPKDSILRYTLVLETAVQGLTETVFEALEQCSIDLQTLGDDKGLSPIELHIFDEVPLSGFVDPLYSHTFFCGLATQDVSQPTSQKDLIYDLRIEKLNEDDTLPSEPLPSQVKKTYDSLIVEPGFMTVNSNFKVTCTATNAAETVYGSVSKLYNSQEYHDSIKVRVSPARGSPFRTPFTIEAIKPPGEALKCVFGYKNKVGEVLVEDMSTAGQRHSSQRQHLQTTLPNPDDGSNTIEVFTRCNDVLSRSKTASVFITIEGDDTVVFDQNTADRFTETISRNIASGSKNRVSDLVVFAETMKSADSANMEQGQLSLSVDILTNAIATQKDINSSETSQLSQVLKDLSVKIVSDSELSAEPSITQSTLQAVGNVLGSNQGSEEESSTAYPTIDDATFEALASTVDVLMNQTGNSDDDETKDTAVEVTSKLFKDGINRLAGSMQAGDSESSTKNFSYDNFQMEVQKKSKDEFAEAGMNRINLQSSSSEEQLQVEIPFDPLFQDVNDFIFASSFSSQTGSDELLDGQKDDKVESAKMLSGLVSVSARATQDSFSRSGASVVSEIEVKDLQTPIKLGIPLTEGIKDPENTKCMYLDEQDNTWQVLGEPCMVPEVGSTKITCCSTHLTTFAVQELVMAKILDDSEIPIVIEESVSGATTNVQTTVTNLKPKLSSQAEVVTGETDGVLVEEEGICTAHLHFVLFVNLFLGILAVTGCCLDRKQKCLFIPSYKDSQTAEQKHEQLQNASIRNSVVVNENGTELQSVKMPSAETPDNEPDQEEGKQAPQGPQTAAIDVNDVKLQMDAVVEANKDSMANLQSNQRASSASVNESQVFSAVDLGLSVKDQKAQLKYEIYTKNQSFGRLFCNAFKFYGRLASVCYSHNPKLGRAAKALNVATQVMVCATIVSMLGLFEADIDSDWSLSGSEVGAVFLLMRLIQGLLGLGMSRNESTSRGFAWVTSFLFVVVYLVCTSVVYQIADREDYGVQVAIIDGVVGCLTIELILYDLLVMPMLLACLGKCSKRVIMHYKGLMV